MCPQKYSAYNYDASKVNWRDERLVYRLKISQQYEIVEEESGPGDRKFWGRDYLIARETHPLIDIKENEEYPPATGDKSSNEIWDVKFSPQMIHRALYLQLREMGNGKKNQEVYDQYKQ